MKAKSVVEPKWCFPSPDLALSVISNPGPDLSPHAFKKAFRHPELLVVVKEFYSFEKITISEILNYYILRNFKSENSFFSDLLWDPDLDLRFNYATGSENGNYFRSDRI
jgi:hypothetical protein